MNSPPDSVNPAMTSATGMGGTTMPHQPYPNALPPHVTTTTSNPAVLLESIHPVTTPQLITASGNKEDEQQEQHHTTMLPAFRTIEQNILPNIAHFGITGVVVGQIALTVNVGGPNPEDNVPQEASYEPSQSNYDLYTPSYYKSISVETMQSTDTIIDAKDADETIQYHFEQMNLEANNNHLGKEDMDPNIKLQPKKGRNKTGAGKGRQITTTAANFITEDGMHKCLECNKLFNKPCYLTQHNKSFHSGDKPFKCTQCGKRFHDLEAHERHSLMHGMTRKHHCDSCPKVFAHRTDLKRHQCIHTGRRPFKCDLCHKGFIRQDHMKKHRETHKKKARFVQRCQPQRINSNRTDSSQSTIKAH